MTRNMRGILKNGQKHEVAPGNRLETAGVKQTRITKKEDMDGKVSTIPGISSKGNEEFPTQEYTDFLQKYVQYSVSVRQAYFLYALICIRVCEYTVYIVHCTRLATPSIKFARMKKGPVVTQKEGRFANGISVILKG